ncbi:LamG-like jellyroll fold domain-containing protein [Marinoscillum sp. MHG1-6]|uniref:LamG-like jellyroll fold domain-containing protein n=1 Tax=Marinoscillum sp. MHG1-6 TaxID=2959627 RepID=UPI00215809C1|nr:LamG-like jellyroll fold domain-containing protein [Marinoscillum sp. MHG1-6]
MTSFFQVRMLALGLLAAFILSSSTVAAQNSLQFDGIDDYVGVGNLGTTPTQGTFETWAWIDDHDDNHGLMDTDASNIASGFRIETTAAGDLYLVVDDNSQSLHHFYLAPDSITGSWMHLAFTWDTGTGSLIGYLDGVQVFNDAVASFPLSFPDVVLGFAYQNTSTRIWDGLIAETRFWNRALTASEVAFLKDQSLSGFQPDLLVYYDYSEGSGTTTSDLSSNGFTGSLFNNVTWSANAPVLAGADVDIPILTFDQDLTTTNNSLITGTIDDVFAVIEVSLDGGATWSPAGNPGDGTWDYDISTDPTFSGSGSYTVDIRAMDDVLQVGVYTGTMELDQVAPVITFDQDGLTVGDPIITGTIDDPAAIIDVSLDLGATYSPATNNGTTWSYDLSGDINFSGDNFYDVDIRATDVALNEGFYSGGVTLSSPSIVVVQPNGGELLTEGLPYEITWSYSGFPGTDFIEIRLSTDGGATFNIINDGTFETFPTNSFSWTPTSFDVTGEGIIEVANTTALIADQSDGIFTVDPAGCDPITISPSVTDNTGCTVPDGQIYVQSSTLVEPTNGYTYELYDDLLNLIDTSSAGQDGAVGYTFANLPGGLYTIRAYNDDNACFDELVDIFVDDLSNPPFVDEAFVFITDESSPGFFDGSIDASTAVGGGSGTYDYYWYEGFGIDVFITNEPSGILSGLTANDYTLVVQDLVSGCSSAEYYFTVNAAAGCDPITITTSATENTSCALPDGQIYVQSSTLSEPISGYTYDLYDQFFNFMASSGPGIDGAIGFTFTGLAPGNYTVEVINGDNSCLDNTSAFVDDLSNPPFVDEGFVFITDESSPGFFDGSIDASTAAGGGSGNYDFYWYEGIGIDVFITNDPSGVLSGLTASDYTLVVQDLVTGCSSGEYYFTVNSGGACDPINITPTISDNTDCANPNGQIYVQSSTLTEPVSGYTYELYDDLLSLIAISPGGQDGTTGYTFTNLIGGLYTIRAYNDDNGCFDDLADIFVDELSNPPFVDEAFVFVSAESSPGAFDGSIDASSAAGGGSGNYDYFWYEGFGTAVPYTSGVSIISGLAAGDYTLVVQDLVTGCSSGEYYFAVNSGGPGVYYEPFADGIPADWTFQNATWIGDPNKGFNQEPGAVRLESGVGNHLTTPHFEAVTFISFQHRVDVNIADGFVFSVLGSDDGGATFNVDLGGGISVPKIDTVYEEFYVDVIATYGTDYYGPIKIVTDGSGDSPGIIDDFQTDGFISGGGPGNYALQFDGVNEYVTIDGIGDYYEQPQLTIEAWVNPSSATSYILSSENNGGWGFYVNGGVLSVTNVGVGGISSTASIPIDTWTHVAVSYDQANDAVRFYQNGTFIEEQTFALFSGSLNSAYTIGARTTSAQYSVQLIDEVRVWGAVLSDADIAARYGEFLYGNEPNLLSYFNFEDGPGSSQAYDYAESGYFGTLYNMDVSNWVAGPILTYPPPINYYESFSSGIPADWTFQNASWISDPDKGFNLEPGAVLLQSGAGNHLTTPHFDAVSYISLQYRVDVLNADGFVFSVLGSDDGGATFNVDLGGGLIAKTDTVYQELYIDVFSTYGTEYYGPIQIVTDFSGDSPGLIDEFKTDGFIGGGGPVGYALDFDGVDDYAETDPINYAGTFTLEAWVILDETIDPGGSGIISTMPESFTFEMGLSSQGYLYASFNGITSDTATTTFINDFNWHHIAMSYDNLTGDAILYVDGNQELIIAAPTGISLTAQSLYFMANTALTKYTRGYLDEVRMWDHIRTQADINNDMFQELNGGAPGLIHYFNFNEGGGTEAYDFLGGLTAFLDPMGIGNYPFYIQPGAPVSGGEGPLTDIYMNTHFIEDQTVPPGTSDVLVYKMEAQIVNGPADIEGFFLRVGGPYDPSDFLNFNFYQSVGVDDFAGAELLGSPTFGTPFGQDTVGLFFNRSYSADQIVYYYVTANISPDAFIGDAFNILTPNSEHFGFGNVNFIGDGLTDGPIINIDNVQPPQSPGGIYFTTSGANSVFFMNLEGGGETPFASSDPGIGDYGLDYWRTQDQIYFIDGSTSGDKIMQVSQDGSGLTLFHNLGTIDTQYGGLAIDTIAQLIYVVDPALGGIREIDITGLQQNLHTVFTENPSDLEINNEFIYWSESGTAGIIYRANLADISNTVQVVIGAASSGGTVITGLTFDPNDGRIYWTNNSGEIRRAFTDGSSVEVLKSGLGVGIRDVEFDNYFGRIVYVNNAGQTTIEATDLEGFARDTLLLTTNPINYLLINTPYDPPVAQPNYALQFEGGLEHLAIPGNPLWARSTWTVEFLFNSSMIPANLEHFNLVNFVGAAPSTNEIKLLGHTGFDVQASGDAGGSLVATGANPNDSAWHHLAIVSNASNDGVVYLDGDSLTLISNVFQNFGPSGDLLIGNGSTGGLILDDFRIWSVARTQEEIMSGRFGVNPQELGLELFYTFNNGPGSNGVNDETGKGYDAMLVNMDPLTDWVLNIPPVANLTGVAIVGGSHTTVEFSAKVDQVSDVYYVISESPTFPTPEQIISGLDGDGNGAYNSGVYTGITDSTTFWVGDPEFSGPALIPATDYFLYVVANNESGPSNIEFQAFTTLPEPAIVTMNSVDLVGGDMIIGSTNNLIYEIELNVAGGDVTMIGFFLTPDPATSHLETDFTQFNFYESVGVDDFAGATLLGSSGFVTGDSNIPDGSIGYYFSSTYLDGSTVYLYVSADIASTATEGFTFAVLAPSGEMNIGVNDPNQVVDGTVNPGAVFTGVSADVTPPVVTFAQDGQTTGNTVIGGTVDDPTATIQVQVNSSGYLAAENDGLGSWTFDLNTHSGFVSDVALNIDILAADALGNDTTIVGSITVDLTAPVVTVDLLLTNNTTPIITGTIDDLNTDSLVVTIAGVGYSPIPSAGIWSVQVSPTALSEGTYDVQVTAVDPYGNTSSDQTVDELVIDVTDPVVSLNTLVTTDDTPPLSGTTNEPVDSVSIGLLGVDYSATVAGNSWNISDNVIPSLAVGSYKVEAAARDLAGNVSTLTLIDSDSIIIQPGAPLASQAINLGFTTFTATWFPRAGVSQYQIDVALDASFTNLITTSQTVSDTSFALTGLDYTTTHYYRVRALGLDGFISQNSNTVAVTTLTDPNTALDSLALWQVYNRTKGIDWTKRVNWKTNKLKNWTGVTLSGTRITGVNLSGFNLQGTFPTIASGLEVLETLDVSSNELKAMPDMARYTVLTTLNVANNHLDFGVLEVLPQLDVTTLFPQKRVGVLADTLLEQSAEITYTLSRAVGGTGNTYTWFKREKSSNTGTSTGETGPTIDRLITSFADEGYYYAKVANPAFQGDTLTTYELFVKVSSLERDRVALMNLYDSTNGAGWTNSSGWGAATVTSDWFGVTVENLRVTKVELAANNLDGYIGESFGDLVSLTAVNLENNNIRSLPDMTLATGLTQLDASGNRLVFTDIVPNFNIAGKDFSQQKRFGFTVYDTIQASTDTTLRFRELGDDQTIYEWYFGPLIPGEPYNNDVVLIEGAPNERAYDIFSIDYAKQGTYRLKVTHPLAPGISLESRNQNIMAYTDFQGNLTVDSTDAVTDAEVVIWRKTPQGPFQQENSATVDMNGHYSIPNVVLGTFLVLARPNRALEQYKEVLQTYYVSQKTYAEADSLQLFAATEGVDIDLISIKPELPVATGAMISGTIESDFDDPVDEENGRVNARRKVRKAACSMRRFKSQGRPTQGVQDSVEAEIAYYVETDDEGYFNFEGVADGKYLINIEFPGVPMNPNSEVVFEIGGDKENQVFEVNALVTELGIEVEQTEILYTLKPYVKDVNFYPNPTDGLLALDYTVYRQIDDLQMVLVTMDGRIIRQAEIPHYKGRWHAELDMTEVSVGIYQLVFTDKAGTFWHSVKVGRK